MSNKESEELKIFRKSVRDYAETELAPHAEEWEKKGEFPLSVYKKMGALGFLGIRIDESYGGAGVNFDYTTAFVEEMVRSRMMGLVISIMMHAEIATPLIQALGNEEQKKSLIPKALTGELIAGLAITEPGAGSDVAAIKTRATKEGDHYVINGEKTFITNGPSAGFLITMAVTDPHAGHKGLSLFIVPTDTAGFSVGKRLSKLGNHTSDTSMIHYENAKVPAANLLGEEGRGFYYIMHNFLAERIVGAILPNAMSTMMWEDGLLYAKERTAFGKTLDKFQVWSHELAQLRAEIEAAKTLTAKAVEMLNRQENPVQEVSMAKLISCELAEKVATRMLQLHGGYGYIEEYPIARYFRDVRLMTIGGGTSEIMREIIIKTCGIG